MEGYGVIDSTRFLIKAMTAAQWTELNPELIASDLYAEIGVERDTGRMKKAPGNWRDLPYMTVTPADLTAALIGYILGVGGLTKIIAQPTQPDYPPPGEKWLWVKTTS